MDLLYAFIIALFLSMLLIPMIMRVAERFSLFDAPDNARKFHVKAVPRLGGIAIIIGFVVSVIIWSTPLDKTVLGLILSTLVLLLFGVWDDVKPLNFKIKFLGQLLAICISVFYGDIVVKTLPLFESAIVPWWIAYPLTIACLLAITNAINLVDGLDGLAGGTSLLSLSVITVLAWLANDIELAILSLAVIGGILGFLRFNTHPAQIFMGDSGSQFLGFMLGCLAILLTQNSNSDVSPAIVFFILGLPIIDTLSVMAQRYSEGRSLFSPDRNHIHHKLLAFGVDHYEAVALIYVTQALFISIAFFGRYESDWLLLSLYLAFCFITLLVFRLSGKYRWGFAREGSDRSHLFKRFFERLNSSVLINKVIAYLIASLIVGHILVAIFKSGNLPDYMMKTSLVLFIALLLQIIFAVLPKGVLERAAYYFLGIFAIFSIEIMRTDSPLFVDFSNYIMLLFAVLVIIGVKFARDREFSVTPLDFLIVFIVIAVPNLPGISGDQLALDGHFNIGTFAIKVIVIFYGVELVFTTFSNFIRWLQIPVLILSGMMFLMSAV